VSAAAPPIDARAPRFDAASGYVRRNGWTFGLLALLAALLLFTKLIQPRYGPIPIQGLATSVQPLVLAAVAQAIVVISGGIDLSIGSMMAFTSVVSATLMDKQTDQVGIAVVLGVLVLGIVIGAVNGALVVLTRVPDIVVTLAMSFVWAGCALLVRSGPGGGAAGWLKAIVVGPLGNEWIPKAAVVVLIVVFVVWIPLSRSRLGLSIYAIGSNRLAAFRSGVPVSRTRFLAYVLTGLFSAMAGLSLTATTSIGSPVPGPYTLLSVAAVVLGGVSLAGGRGGVFGPIVAVVVLQLVQTDLTFLRFDSNYAYVAQGAILILVTGFSSLLSLRKARP
jgi:ribose transport system permease protein